MTSETILIAFFFVLALVALGLYLRAQLQSLRPANDQSTALQLMQQQVDAMRQQLQESLAANAQLISQQMSHTMTTVNTNLNQMTTQIQSSQGAIGQRLDHAARVVGEVQNRLGALDEASKRIFEMGKNLTELQNILRAPKLRGGLGELWLEDLLQQIFPPQCYTMQYAFKSGERVDAALHMMNGIVPIDSKFPLESFKRLTEAATDEERRAARRNFVQDVKKHIDSIAHKYIVPEEKTFDFALMYIPAENVYYETIIKDENFGDDKSIASYALTQRVVPVSPNSFYAYLQAILLGLRGLHVEESAHEIIRSLQQLRGDFAKFEDAFQLVGKHLGHAQSSYTDAEKRLDKMQTRLDQTLESQEQVDLKPAAAVGALNSPEP
ncbi:MAG: DNA recombination protein RmuC [Terriglobia bacterium]